MKNIGKIATKFNNITRRVLTVILWMVGILFVASFIISKIGMM